MDHRISDDAIKEATGKAWNGWLKILEDADARNMIHKEIVAFLMERHDVSHWWAQTIVVGYERSIGRREKGQTQDSGFQVGVQKTVHASIEDAWELLISPSGIKCWLGNGVSTLLWEIGTTYETRDGISGEIRVYKPYHHLRITWQPPAWKKASTLQIRVIAKKEGKVVFRLHQEGLKDARARKEMKAKWKAVLDELAGML